MTEKARRPGSRAPDERYRLFVALVPPAAARAHLAEALAALAGPGLSTPAPEGSTSGPPALRWVPADRLHVTVAFYGDVPVARLDELTVRLRRAVSRARLPGPPRLRLAGAGRFGHRVLHIGLHGEVDALPRLASLAAAAGRRVGAGVDSRGFTAHVTVARARGQVDLRSYVAALASYEGPWWQAQELTLLRSRTGPDPSYHPLASWQLGPALTPDDGPTRGH
jgi:2'-5' RNA ligase